MSLSDRSFVQISNEITYHPLLSLEGRGMYQYVLSRSFGGNGCFASIARIMQDTNSTKWKVRKSLEELVSLGLVLKKRRGLTKTNVYFPRVLVNGRLRPLEELVDSLSESSQEDTDAAERSTAAKLPIVPDTLPAVPPKAVETLEGESPTVPEIVSAAEEVSTEVADVPQEIETLKAPGEAVDNLTELGKQSPDTEALEIRIADTKNIFYKDKRIYTTYPQALKKENLEFHQFLRTRLRKRSYETWLKNSYITYIDDNSVILVAESDKGWIKEWYMGLLLEYFGKDRDIELM